MSQILKDLNKLAEKIGAPIVGRNISEQVRAISTFYEGTSHGANIAERINEIRHGKIGSYAGNNLAGHSHFVCAGSVGPSGIGSME